MPTIKKWGNSLSLRIPAHLAARLNLGEDSVVECSVSDDALLVKPVKSKPKYSLCDLLAGITEANLHGETGTGPEVGEEIL